MIIMFSKLLDSSPTRWQLAATLVMLMVALGLFRLMKVGKRDPRLPPGPPTLPIIGNLHQIPVTGIHKKFKKWADQYGGIFSLKFGPGTMIVLCDREAIHNLLDKKGSIYSERPANYIASLVTHGDSFPFMDNTPRWRAHRKIVSHNFSPRVLDEKISKVQDAEINMLMLDLVKTPQDFYKHILRTTSSVACSVVWGHRGRTYDDFWGHGVYKALDQYSTALEPGANPPVDEFPFLKHVPARFAPWKSRAQNSYIAMDQVWAEARRRVDARRAEGVIRNCIVDRILDNEEKLDVELNDNQLNHLLGIVVEGGADTTGSSILTSILYLALHPEFQEKARKEIDLVCGPNRIPMWSDFEQLPYVNCIIKEAMRIHPVLPVGVPHRVKNDDWYKGMFIPKDSTVTIPVWALHYSSKTGYEGPETYNPDRFLGYSRLASEYAGASDFQSRDHYGYGAGRRICPGMHMAERTQWRITARLLWAFEIHQAVDPETGNSIVIDVENYQEGLNHCPKPFQAIFKPRSQAYIDTISREAEMSMETLQPYSD